MPRGTGPIIRKGFFSTHICGDDRSAQARKGVRGQPTDCYSSTDRQQHLRCRRKKDPASGLPAPWRKSPANLSGNHEADEGSECLIVVDEKHSVFGDVTTARISLSYYPRVIIEPTRLYANRDIAMPTCTALPVWKPTHNEQAEKETQAMTEEISRASVMRRAVAVTDRRTYIR